VASFVTRNSQITWLILDKFSDKSGGNLTRQRYLVVASFVKLNELNNLGEA
jgi:hypothetical protein